jgi:hypothetical protein
VSNAAKLFAKMQRNPRDWRIEDLKVAARSVGIDHDQHGRSHVISSTLPLEVFPFPRIDPSNQSMFDVSRLHQHRR